MKIVTFTAPCSGIGAVYNKGDVGRFPDSVADAIVAAKKGTAEPVPDDTGKRAHPDGLLTGAVLFGG